MRQPLSNGQIIQFNDNKKYFIERICGMGASSIVYDARKESGERIRIKECYPISLPIRRNEKSELIVDENVKDQFESIKKCFKKSFDLQKLLRDKNKLTNSIMPLEGLYSGYGTSYITSVVMEGKDFSQNPARTLISLIKLLKSVAKVINVYHEFGYLHLDIKPANIFRIPETDEHILMFDFDSLVEKKILKTGDKVIISYSKRWAAPEILSLNWNKICEATDVYAIGAIFFYSIFGREVTVSDRRIWASWDYKEAINGIFDDVNPQIYATVTEFLHKTIVCNVNRRYSDMNQVIAALNELEKLSNQEKRFICSKYRNGIAGFVGRKYDLNQINVTLEKNNAVAVVGMGGIGKTELVNKYTNNVKDQYAKVVWLDYSVSIKNMICSDELKINKYERQEGQTEENYYHEKMQLLHELFCPNDLLIIDNYDDNDNNITDILSLPCKIIITTRNDLRDEGISCIYLDKLDKCESLSLFRIHNEKEYDDDNKNAIKGIIEYINYHTFTIELVSKYLQHSSVTPAELFFKLKDVGNLEIFNNVNIRSSKDGNIHSKTILAHIKKLYNITDLSEEQKEIMLGLSLMPDIKISRRLFEILFAWSTSNNELNELINRSWVKYDRLEDKIYLHPLIQQIVVLEKPNTKNCRRFLAALIKEYDKTKTSYENEIWRKLFESVFKLISGEDHLYAMLCKREGSDQSLIKASEIFANDGSKEYLEVSLNILKKDLHEILDENMDNSEWESEKDSDRKVEQRVNRIIDRCNKEIIDQLFFIQTESLCDLQYLIDVAKTLCDELDKSDYFLLAIKPREYLCKEISRFPKDIFDYICSLEQNYKLEKNVSISIFLKLEDLFNPDAGSLFGFASEYLYDEKMSNWIKKELRKYRKDDPEIGMAGSIKDENSGIITYFYRDGDELTINTITGLKEWVDYWQEGRDSFNSKGDEEVKEIFSTNKYQRKEVCMVMQEDEADETWYDYYCALIDSAGKTTEEADLIWMEAYREYHYNLRFTCSNAKEIAMECLEKISKDYFVHNWSYVGEYCDNAIELNRMDACRNCYIHAVKYLLTGSNKKSRDTFFDLCFIGSYAQKAGFLDDALRCMAFAVICLIEKEKAVVFKEDFWNIDTIEINELLRKTFKGEMDSDITNDINWMFEMNTSLLRENKEIYDLIKSFLIREKYKDIDFIRK